MASTDRMLRLVGSLHPDFAEGRRCGSRAWVRRVFPLDGRSAFLWRSRRRIYTRRAFAGKGWVGRFFESIAGRSHEVELSQTVGR
jgi:hypothetical protein